MLTCGKFCLSVLYTSGVDAGDAAEIAVERGVVSETEGKRYLLDGPARLPLKRVSPSETATPTSSGNRLAISV